MKAHTADLSFAAAQLKRLPKGTPGDTSARPMAELPKIDG